jgi:NAD-dependent dihydropyrimidine dehydrogenase PreA subunit
MSYIIGKACIGCIDTSCVKVCPVDCIHGPIKNDDSAVNSFDLTDEEKQGKQLYIHPVDCINCGACISECPVDAIYRDEKEAIQLGDLESVNKNYDFFGLKFN